MLKPYNILIINILNPFAVYHVLQLYSQNTSKGEGSIKLGNGLYLLYTRSISALYLLYFLAGLAQ